jgi:hypothetical protein
LEATNVCNLGAQFSWVGCYYRRFILNFSKIAKLITELLKKGTKYVWSKDCDEAFQTLKKLLTTSLVLAQPDIAKSFNAYCDIRKGQLEDAKIQEIKEQIKEDKAPGFSIDDQGTLWYKKRICVPEIKEIRESILCEAHDSAYSIHP